MQFQRHSYFTLTILVVIAAAVLYALQWPLRTNILILVLGGVAVVLLIIQLCREVFAKEPSQGARSGMDVVVDDDMKGREATRRMIVFWGWLLGLSVGIWFVGFLASVTLFGFLYSLLNGGRWYWSVFIGLLTFGITYGLFEMVLHAPWPEPYLLHLIGR